MRPAFWKLTLLLLLTVGALFSKELFLWSVEGGSRILIQKKLGAHFSADLFEWKEGKLLVKGGKLSGKVEGSFDSASWKPSFSFFKRELGGHIEVEQLHLVQKEIRSLSGNRRRRFSPLHLNFDIAIPGARLQIADVDLMLDVVRESRQLTLNSDLSGQNLSDLYKMVCQIWKLPEPLADWEVMGGDLRGELQVSFAKGQLYNLVGHLDAKKIEAENSHLAICGEWEKLHVDFDLDMSSAMKVDTWDGTFSLIGGRLALLSSGPDFWDGMWDLTKLHSMISVKNGKVDNSFLRGTFFGMEGEIDLDWYSRETLMSLAFQCNSKEMLPILPERFGKGFGRSFPDDDFALTATIKRASDGLLLEGELQAGSEHKLDFGCNFGAKKRGLQQLPPMGTFADRLKEQFCLSSNRLGWFRGEQFPLEKFFSPFIIPDERMELSGVFNFEGTFDERRLVVFYEGEKLHMEGKSFDLKVDRICEEVSSNQVAVHTIDLKTGEHEGVLPLSYAQYTHKKRGVVFEPISAMVYIHNNEFSINEVDTSWSGLLLHGDVKVVLNGFSNVDTDIVLHDTSGPLEDAIELFNYFYPVPFKERVEGSFETNKQGFCLEYRQGKLTDVNFSAHCLGSTQLYGVAIEDADFQFGYDRSKKEITFSSGKLQVVHDQTEYPLSFEEISLAPDSWHLQMPQLKAQLVSGVLTTEGVIESSGLWEDDHLVLHDFKVGDWRGELEMVGTALKEFHVKQGENELFLSGDFQSKRFNVERVVFDLSSLLPKRLEMWHPEGVFEGSGELTYNGELEGEILANFHDLHFGGIHFGEGENLRCSLSQSSGVTIEGLEARVGSARYKLGGFHYIPAEDKLHFDGFDFSIPASRLQEIVDIASELFPGKIHNSIRQHLIALKQDEEFAGRINIELFPNTLWIALSLNDGRYTLFDQECDLRSFTLSYDPLLVNVKTEARYLDDYYWLEFEAETPTLSEGKLAIYEKEGESLEILWDPGWQVSQVSGKIAGCEADLVATPEREAIDFEGSLLFETQRMIPLLSGKLRQMLERIAICGGYKLDGQWHFRKTDPFNPDFYGTIEGRNCGAYQVACNNFSSDLQYCKDTLRMHDLHVIDWSGTLTAKELTLNRDLDISIEQLFIENFRLSRLNSPWTDMEKRERPMFRSFCVPHFNLINFQGKLDEPDSLRGSGSLFFTNYAKKTLFSNLLQLPTEISARLGLDLTNLIPVKGQVIYRIEDSKVKVTELRDVYSEGKRARFFLADDEPASIDFSGNLDVKIRMKQYTLLMKLAEFFTLSVKGTVTNPLYTVTNQD